MVFHDKYIRRCLELADLGKGNVSPNPLVGAVIVHHDTIIGEGYHQKYGEAHAEVNAINHVVNKFPNYEELLKQATIYVSLEPCTHFGKTPPCADLIIRHQIPNVVIGCRDPFTEVNGKGIDKLKEAGINIIIGILENECKYINRRFFTRVLKQRPYVILKWAQTLDGFFAPNHKSQFWITGIEAKKLVHQWRAEEDAVLVGKNTAEIDNPMLNVRYGSGKSPKRVVIDRNLSLPSSLNIFDNSVQTFIFNATKMDIERKNTFIALEDFDRFVPEYILYQLYLQDVQSIIIEGGAITLNSFIAADLWDEARIFSGVINLNEGKRAPYITGNILGKHTIGNDELLIWENEINKII